LRRFVSGAQHKEQLQLLEDAHILHREQSRMPASAIAGEMTPNTLSHEPQHVIEAAPINQIGLWR
jgi:hypothetical protein